MNKPYRIIFIKCFNVVFVNNQFCDEHKYNVMHEIFFNDNYKIIDEVKINWIENLKIKLWEYGINLEELINL